MTHEELVEEMKRGVRELKCVNGAMYFGAVEDDTCDCKTRCQNEQTYEHALEELDAFLTTLAQRVREETIEEVKECLTEEIPSMPHLHIDAKEGYRILQKALLSTLKSKV